MDSRIWRVRAARHCGVFATEELAAAYCDEFESDETPRRWDVIIPWVWLQTPVEADVRAHFDVLWSEARAKAQP